MMTLAASSRWPIVAGVAGVVLLAAAGLVGPTVSTALAAAGGALVAGAATAWAGRSSGPPALDSDSGRVDAMTSALIDGVLDLYSLVEVGRAVSASLHLDELLTTTLKRVAEATGIENYGLFVFDSVTHRLVAKSAGGAVAQALPRSPLPPDKSLADRVCRTRVAELLTGETPLGWLDTPPPSRSVIAVPLLGWERPLGALLVYAPAPAAFSARDFAYFKAVGRQLSIALDNATLLDRATDMSLRDPLTGLFNRRYLEEVLEAEIRRAARYSLPLAVTMIDVDNFKAYNDLHGHPRGDEVLCEVAQRLRDQVRRTDIVTRYGGEEFVVLLPMTSKAHARLIGEKLRAAVASLPFAVTRERAGDPLTISAGVAACPDDATSAADLLRAADTALYAAKRSGRNRVELFQSVNA
jgi:diguanylate cyclase (GGDEF)-like protein